MEDADAVYSRGLSAGEMRLDDDAEEGARVESEENEGGIGENS